MKSATGPGQLNGAAFLQGGGVMGAHIRAFDWAATPLGPPDQWPIPLRTTVRIMLTTGHPAFIFWGPELLCFYNDAYSRSIGPEKHPGILGTPGRDAWPEIWHIIGPQIGYVMAAKGSTWDENALVPIIRHGKKEDVYWTYSYSPIDEPGAPHGVGGVLVLCSETTEQVLAAERLKAAEGRWRQLFDQAPGFMCVMSGPQHRFEFATPTEGHRAVQLGHQAEPNLCPGVFRTVRRLCVGRLERGFHQRPRCEATRQGRGRTGGATRLPVGGSVHLARRVQSLV